MKCNSETNANFPTMLLAKWLTTASGKWPPIKFTSSYHNFSSSSCFRLKVNIHSAPQRQAALFGVNIWPQLDKKKKKSDSVNWWNSSRSCFDRVSISQGSKRFHFHGSLRSQTEISHLNPRHKLLNRPLLLIYKWDSEFKSPLCLSLALIPLSTLPLSQMKTKYLEMRAMNSWQLGATPTEKALWKNGWASCQLLADNPTF